MYVIVIVVCLQRVYLRSRVVQLYLTALTPTRCGCLLDVALIVLTRLSVPVKCCPLPSTSILSLLTVHSHLMTVSSVEGGPTPQHSSSDDSSVLF